jgi:sialic acid synthase SpsE
MTASVKIDSRQILAEDPVYIIAERGIEDDEGVEMAINLLGVIMVARWDSAGVRMQIPATFVSTDQPDLISETTWRMATYLGCRARIEFWDHEYRAEDAKVWESDQDWHGSPGASSLWWSANNSNQSAPGWPQCG